MSTLRDLLKIKSDTAAAVSADQSSIAADQAKLTSDQAKLVADTAADQAADKAVSDGLGAGEAPFAVDTLNPNPDGTVNLLVKDTSPAGYHVIAIPTLDLAIPTPAPAPPTA